MDTFGNNCACELNTTPEACVIHGAVTGIFPGESCSPEFSSKNAVATRTSENNECSCSPLYDSVQCDNDQFSGTECQTSTGAAGVRDLLMKLLERCSRTNSSSLVATLLLFFKNKNKVVVNLGDNSSSGTEVSQGTRTKYRRGRTRGAHSRVVNLCNRLPTVRVRGAL